VVFGLKNPNAKPNYHLGKTQDENSALGREPTNATLLPCQQTKESFLKRQAASNLPSGGISTIISFPIFPKFNF
jgi:hypothetical protein